tara:strand:+ start:202 stop:783 length:582 start_codon:yes stop_codon:yes gene_type:complete
MDSPWLLKYNKCIFCIPLKVLSTQNSTFHSPSYIHSAVVLFQNEQKANHFKKNHLIKVLNSKTLVYDTYKDILNESVIDVKLNINYIKYDYEDNINNIHLLKNRSIVNDENLTAVELKNVDNDTIVLYSIFAHAVFLYINDIQVKNDKLILDSIALNPFRIEMNNKSVLDDSQMKTDILLKHLEKLYNASESI